MGFVRARGLGMIPKITDYKPIQRMSEFRFRFGHCGRAFLSPAIYKSDLAKRVAISGSVFQASIHFRSASTNVFHLNRFPS